MVFQGVDSIDNYPPLLDLEIFSTTKQHPSGARRCGTGPKLKGLTAGVWGENPSGFDVAEIRRFTSEYVGKYPIIYRGFIIHPEVVVWDF